MQDNTEWTLQYHNDAAKAKMAARRGEWSPELQERVSKQWTELIADVERSLGEDPASEKVQALADRWTALVEEFTRPTYSAICLGLLPAGAMMVGLGMRVAI